MRRISIAAALLPASLWLACATHNGWDPIEIDASQKKPASAATPVPATPTPGIVPAPTAEPPAPVIVPTATAAPAPPSTSRPSQPSSTRTAEGVARARADAFNRHDLDALAALYAPDARIFDPPDRLRDSGTAAIRESFARTFSMAPDVRTSVTDVLNQGNQTVVHETQTGAGTTRSVIRILEVRDGRIAVEWILTAS
jgi:hypothetical protein